MITFMPCTDFGDVARCLDDKRLGAQRYEAWSILKWLRDPERYPQLVRAGYCAMWRGYEGALVRYTNAMLREWAARGKKNDLLKPDDESRGLDETEGDRQPEMPPWLGVERLHSYHRHALVAKLPEHYSGFGWSEDGGEYNGSYLWPVRTDDDAWVLRWPKSMKAAPIPIHVSAAPPKRASKRARASKARASKKARYQRMTTTRKIPTTLKRGTCVREPSGGMRLRSGRFL